MLTFALALPLLLQGSPIHAGLHPKTADLYIELGDASALWPALDASPMALFLKDAEIQPLLAAIGKPVSGPLKDTVKGLLSEASPEAKVEAWFDGLKSTSFSWSALGPASETRAAFGAELVVDFATPEQAKAFEAMVSAEAEKVEPLPSPAGYTRLAGKKPSDDLWCHLEGTRIVLGNTGTLADDYAARAGGKADGLSKGELFPRFQKLEAAKGVVVGWMVLGRPMNEIIAALGDNSDVPLDALSKLPSDLSPFATPKVARMQFADGRYITEMLSARTSGASEAVVDPAWLDGVPDEAMLVFSMPFDSVAAGKTLRALLAGSEETAASLAAIEQKLGFGLERVFAHLGPGLSVYVGPLAGIGLPQLRAYIDCKDPAAFTKDVEAFFTALGETLPGVGAKTKGYKVKPKDAEEKVEVPITTISLPPEFSQNPMMSVSPSFAPAGKRLIFALNSLDVKSDLKRFIAGDAGGVVPGAHPLAKAGFQVPSGSQAVVMMDWAKLIGGLIDTAKAVLPMMGGEAPFDLSKLPSGAKISSFFKPTFHYVRLVEGGVYRRNEGSFGPETWLGLLGAGYSASKRMQPSFAPVDAPAASEPVEAPK